MKQIITFLIFWMLPLGLLAQEDTPKNWALDGYLKNLQTLIFLEDGYLQDNLIHNRLNFKWYASENFTLKAELRSRIFFGDIVRSTPGYGSIIDNANNDFFDLSLVLLDRNGIVIHSMLDRFYGEYVTNNWEVRLGRQRVNWGISTIWNPNDVFNAFTFTDFDYEERPGSDALRIKYYWGFASSIEVAVKAFDQGSEAVAATLLKLNRWEYDFQFLAGIANNNGVIGGGWAGNIKNMGFKGEWSYFIPLEEGKSSFSGTLGLDYVFSNSLYLNVGYLYSSLGATSASVANLFSFDLSAQLLYPYRHAVLTQLSYPVHPLLTGGVALIYSPVTTHALFVNPTLTYSIKSNWDLDFVGQFVLEDDEGYQSPIQALFLRIKYSF